MKLLSLIIVSFLISSCVVEVKPPTDVPVDPPADTSGSGDGSTVGGTSGGTSTGGSTVGGSSTGGGTSGGTSTGGSTVGGSSTGGGTSGGTSTGGSTGGSSADSDCSQMSLGLTANLNSFNPYPAGGPWTQDISSTPADPNSSALLKSYSDLGGGNSPVHADFSADFGLLYNIVDSSTTPRKSIKIDMYEDESDSMTVPIPSNAGVEAGSQSCKDDGDCHMIILDRKNCWLYETWSTSLVSGSWRAGNMAVWDLLKNRKRPLGWTSADAAGLSVFAGLLRYEEVAKGEVNHALRFTLKYTPAAYVFPASHWAGNKSSSPFPMGTRLRLKKSFDISSFSKNDQVILKAMKKYGLILADNGSNMYITGVQDSRWKEADVVGLAKVHLTDFEVMPKGTVYSESKRNIPTGAPPKINSFKASATSVAAGKPVTLSWSTSNSSWDFIDVLGPQREQSVVVNPTKTTTYTIYSTNEYGRSRKSITVSVK